MAVQNRTTLKSYFETGDTPTQAQFIDLIDSFFALTENDSDDILEGSVNKFVTSAEKAKITALNVLVSTTVSTGALTGGATKTVTHGLNITTDSTILVARDDSDTNNIQVALLRPTTVNAFEIKANVNLSNLKVKIIGIKAS